MLVGSFDPLSQVLKETTIAMFIVHLVSFTTRNDESNVDETNRNAKEVFITCPPKCDK